MDPSGDAFPYTALSASLRLILGLQVDSTTLHGRKHSVLFLTFPSVYFGISPTVGKSTAPKFVPGAIAMNFPHPFLLDRSCPNGSGQKAFSVFSLFFPSG